MESTVWQIAALIFAAVAGFCLAAGFVIRLQRISMTSTSSKKGKVYGFLAWRLRHGFSGLNAVARLLLKNADIANRVEEGRWACVCKGYESTAETCLSTCLGYALAVGAIVCLVANSVLVGVLVGAGIPVALGMKLKSDQDKRLARMRLQTPEALRSLSSCFSAGFTLLQSFEQVAKETEEPLKSVFERVAHMLEVGYTTSQALAAFKESSAMKELTFVAVALDVQHQTGGGMAGVLDVAQESINSEIELARTLEVQTAQARMSSTVVSIMPFVLVLILSVMTEGFFDPFFESTLGFLVLLLAAGLLLAGVVSVRRMLKSGGAA